MVNGISVVTTAIRHWLPRSSRSEVCCCRRPSSNAQVLTTVFSFFLLLVPLLVFFSLNLVPCHLLPPPIARLLRQREIAKDILRHLREDRHNDGAVFQPPDALADVEHEVREGLA